MIEGRFRLILESCGILNFIYHRELAWCDIAFIFNLRVIVIIVDMSRKPSFMLNIKSQLVNDEPSAWKAFSLKLMITYFMQLE